MRKIIISFVFVLLILACKSTPTIPDDTSAVQLIQLGQDAESSLNYKLAENYYNTVIMRYGMDTSIYIEARYELGHLCLKQKRYAEAYNYFSEILDIFENAEFGTIPQAYKKLALMGLDQIPEKYKIDKTENSD